MEFLMRTSTVPHHMLYEASLTVLADWILWASTYQSMTVPMPKPPSVAMKSMVTNHRTGKSPDVQPVKAKGFSLPVSPSSESLAMISAGPPAAIIPQMDTTTIMKKAITPCWKSAMTTPQYPAEST